MVLDLSLKITMIKENKILDFVCHSEQSEESKSDSSLCSE
jgi:hypothetical protein